MQFSAICCFQYLNKKISGMIFYRAEHSQRFHGKRPSESVHSVCRLIISAFISSVSCHAAGIKVFDWGFLLFICYSCCFLLLCFVRCRKLPDRLGSTEETLCWVKADPKRTLLTLDKGTDVVQALLRLTERCFNLSKEVIHSFGVTSPSPLTLLRIIHQAQPLFKGGGHINF